MNGLPSLAWHAIDSTAAAREVACDPRTGLSAAEAAARLARHGPNTISARGGRPWWVRFLLQFYAPLAYILLVAGAVTFWLAEYTDSAVIMGVVLANALIGFVQEQKAVVAIDALSRSMRIEATVRREGERRRIDAADLVVGDVALLEPGDKVPADLRLLDGSAGGAGGAVKDLRIDESTLTGERKPSRMMPPRSPWRRCSPIGGAWPTPGRSSCAARARASSSQPPTRPRSAASAS